MEPNELPGDGKLLTFDQLAELLSVAPQTLYKNWKSWGIPAYRVGRLLRFKQSEVDAWLESRVA